MNITAYPQQRTFSVKYLEPNFFTKLDASNAYCAILCFRFRFTRLPYGIHRASEICQLQISEVIDGTEGCANAQDDILIWTNNQEPFVFVHNRSKRLLEVTEITFSGYKLSAKGVEADPRKKMKLLQKCHTLETKRKSDVLLEP